MEFEPANEEERIVSELSEKDKRTVQKFHRQLSSHSILSIRSDDALDDLDNRQLSDDDSEEITEEDALRLQRVIQAFRYYKDSNDPTSHDDIDGGKRYQRLSSINSIDFLSSTSESRYVSPGRFHVSLTEDAKNAVKDLNAIIQRGIRRTRSTEYLIVKHENTELASAYCKQENYPSVNKYNEFTLNNPQFLNSGGLEANPRHQNDINSGYFNDNFGDDRGKSTWKNGTANGHAIYNQRNSHAWDNIISPSLLSPLEKFRWAARRVIRLERKRKKEIREKKRQDYLNKLWKRRGDVGWLGLLFGLVGPCAFIADSATDLKVASDHFTAGHPWWGFFTLMLVIFPAVLMNIVSYSFYKDDEDQTRREPESGWKTVKITHCLQIGILERYWRMLVKGYKIKFKKPDNVTDYKLYIAMNLDTAMLQMILAFTEDAPQLVLQLYILIRRKLVEKLLLTSLQDIWTMASIFFSFISYSRAVVNYISCLRDSKADKGILRWYGYAAMWFWRAFTFISRVLVLVFFATEFHLWFFLVLFLHFSVILFMTRSHKVNFFADQKALRVLIRVTIAYIHTFCYFILEARRTVRWAIEYYTLIAVEAVIFSTLWFTNNTRYVSLKFELAGMSIIFLTFAVGLLLMVAYYKFLHPKFKRPQTKWYTKAIPTEELCENIENENEDEKEGDGEGDVYHGLHLTRNRAASVIRQVGVWV